MPNAEHRALIPRAVACGGFVVAVPFGFSSGLVASKQYVRAGTSTQEDFDHYVGR